jgi:hypothetical protein
VTKYNWKMALSGMTRHPRPEEIIRLAHDEGMTNAQIVRILTGGRTFRDAQQIARDYAHLLDLSLKDFMDLRRND